MDRRAAPRIAGRVPDWLVLPGNLRGVERTVRIAPERVRHLVERRPEWAEFCLAHMGDVLADPQFIGYRPAGDSRRVEFVRSMGAKRRWLLVAVKFLDEVEEAWVSTAHPLGSWILTRRMRNGTMWSVRRGP